MEFYQGKYNEGVMDLKTCQKMIDVISHLEQRYYNFMEPLGSGTFGSVIKVKNILTNEERAVKVVSERNVSEGEMMIWAKLDANKNILPLLAIEYVLYAKSYIFITPVHPASLEKEILQCSLRNKSEFVNERIRWLKEILVAVAYLHENDLAHLDIKPNNVLISKERSAILTDFGFLTSSRYPVREYGAPLLYRCPEGIRTDLGMTEVDGQKFDVWSIGTLAFEMFTKMALYRKMSNRKCRSNNWHKEVYPVLKKRLQKKRFTSLMGYAFPKCLKIIEPMDDVLSFITSCLTLEPEKRPTVLQLQSHSLFGGNFKNVQLEPHEDIWCTRVAVQKVNSDCCRNNTIVPVGKIIKSEINPSIRVVEEDICTDERLPVVLDNNALDEIKQSSKEVSNQEATSEVKIDAGSKMSCVSSHVKTNFDGTAPEREIKEDICTDVGLPVLLENNTFVVIPSVSVTANSDSTSQPHPSKESEFQVASKDIASAEVSNQEAISDIKPDAGSELCCMSSCVKCNSNDDEALDEKINPIRMSCHENSSKVSKDDRVSDDTEAMLVESSCSSEEPKAVSNFSQRIKSWFRKRKSTIVGCFTACVTCVRPSGKGEE